MFSINFLASIKLKSLRSIVEKKAINTMPTHKQRVLLITLPEESIKPPFRTVESINNDDFSIKYWWLFQSDSSVLKGNNEEETSHFWGR